MSIKTTVLAEMRVLENSIKREKAIKANMFDLDAVVSHIQCMQDDGTPLEPDAPYENFDAWLEAVNKERKGYQSSLATIAKNKELLIAFRDYVENNPEV